MRKSQPRTGFRPLRAGIAVAATAAAVVAGIATPAYATDVAVTTTPTQAITTGGSVITFTGTNVLSGITSPGGRFIASTASCPSAYDGANGGTAGTGLTKADANGGTVTTPVLAAGTYKLCLYANATTGAIAGHSTTNTTVVTGGTFPSPGPTGGGTSTFTSTGTFTNVTATIGVTFTAAAATCPDKYTPTSSSATVIASTAVKAGNNAATVTVPNTLVQGTNYMTCLYNGVVASTSVLLARASTNYAVMPAVTISPKNGPAGGGYSMTIATPTATITGSTPKVSFSVNPCTSTYTTGSSADPWGGVVTKISNSKVAVAVPAGVDTDDPSAVYNVCLYASSVGALLGAPGLLTIAPPLAFGTLTVSVNGATAASTGSGPAQGGTLVEFIGIDGLPSQASLDTGATLTASLGDSEITDITVTDTDAFSGYTSPHAAGDEQLTVTTAAGSITTSGDVFTFSYGITVLPTTAQPEASVTLDVLGSGFAGATVASDADGSTAPTTGLAVFLATNGWFAAAAGGDIVATGLTAQCTGVTPISDTELICTLDLSGSLDATNAHLAATPVAVGAYHVVVVNDAAEATLVADVDFSRISSGSTFTVADY